MENLEESLVKKRTRKKWPLVVVIIIAFTVGAFRVGYAFGHQGYVFIPKEFKVVNRGDTPLTVDYKLLWQAIDAVNKNFIEGPANEQKVLYGAVKGAVSATGDQYTEFFTPEELQSFKTDLSGSFGGIGAEIGKRNGNITVIAPLEGSPAQKAGILAKDIIVKVNGEDTVDWGVDQAVQKIRGPKGSEVTLTVYRDGKNKTFDLKITRDQIEVKSVKWQIKEEKSASGKNLKIAVITLSRFGDDTKDLFDKAVADINSKSVDGIVLDLRNDPGGYLETSVDIASNWVDSGKLIVSEAHSDGKTNQYKSYGYGKLAGKKTVVLINGGSASAAEILSGALHDYGLAKLIGEKSYGKGSVQELIPLPGNSAVKVTIAKWITPNGKNLNKDGLNPDIEVKLTEDDIAAQKDPQMDKAMEEVIK